MERLTVALLNDSFPPTIDGVASVVLNYASIIQKNHGTAVEATPWYPDVTDNYPFDVLRYPSANVSKRIGYRAGYPFDPIAVTQLEKRGIDIIHTHCPFVSTVLARVLRYYTGAPVVFTYHTKFDYDIAKRVAFNPIRKVSVKFLMANINACDEVWVVSEGAGENLRSLGYKGSYLVMDNGTDFARGRAGGDEVGKLSRQLGLDAETPVFLFVGRMMWYKGVRLILDGLKTAKDRGRRFRMILVGDGVDRPEIMAYARELGMEGDCIFPGAIRDRELLRTYFSRADLFIFPNNYDTNGIVVKEAAACDCPALLLKGSCAAEGIENNETGVLVDESPEAVADGLEIVWNNPELLRQIGRNAGERVYLSWEDAVARAYQRYEVVLQNERRLSRRLPAGQMLFQGVHDVQEAAREAEFQMEYGVRRVRHTYRLAGRRLRRGYRRAGNKVKEELQRIIDDIVE